MNKYFAPHCSHEVRIELKENKFFIVSSSCTTKYNLCNSRNNVAIKFSMKLFSHFIFYVLSLLYKPPLSTMKKQYQNSPTNFMTKKRTKINHTTL